MTRLLLCVALACATLLRSPCQAQDEQKVLRAAVSVDENTRPATKFSRKVPQLTVFFVGDRVKIGEKVRAVWTAEDVGNTAPKNTKIAEDTIAATEEEQTGSFILDRPPKGWAVGKYRVELYVGAKLVETLKFDVTDEE